MKNARTLLSEAGSGLEDVMKTRIYVGDRAYREAAYQGHRPALRRHQPLLDRPHRAWLRPPRDPVRDRHGDHPEQGYAAPAPSPVPHRRGLPGRPEARDAVLSVGSGRQRRPPARPDRLHPGGRVSVPGRPRRPGRPGDEEHRRAARRGRRVTRRHLQDSHLHPAPRAPRGPSTAPSAGISGGCTRAAPASSSMASPAPRSWSRSTWSRSFRTETPTPARIDGPPGPKGRERAGQGVGTLRIGCGERVVAEPRRLADPDLRDPPSGRVAREEELERGRRGRPHSASTRTYARVLPTTSADGTPASSGTAPRSAAKGACCAAWSSTARNTTVRLTA